MIESQQNKITFKIGESLVFNFPYKFFERENIQCFLAENENSLESIKLEQGKDFFVQIKNDYSEGADITLAEHFAEKKGMLLSVIRVLPAIQETSLPEQGKLPSEALEVQLDKIVMITQQLKEELSRCGKLPIHSNDQSDAFEQILDTIWTVEKAAKEAVEKAEKALEELKEITSDSGSAGLVVERHNKNMEAHKLLFDSKMDKSGGVLSGTLLVDTADYLFRNSNSSHLCMNGAKDYGKGASLLLIGGELPVVVGGDVPGSFKLWANDGTNAECLVGMPDGRMSWKHRPVPMTLDGIYADETGNFALNVMRAPNYEGGLDRVRVKEYTAPANGWVVVTRIDAGTGVSAELCVNGRVVGEPQNYYISTFIPVKKGDLMYARGGLPSTWGVRYDIDIYFYPF